MADFFANVLHMKYALDAYITRTPKSGTVSPNWGYGSAVH